MTTTDSERLVDPELRRVLEQLPRTRYGAFDLDDLAASRRLLRGMSVSSTTPAITISNVQTPHGGPMLRLFRDESASDPQACMMWFHAGGQILSRADEDDAYLAELSARLGIAIAAVDYVLAPEHRAPAAAYQGLAAYRYLHDHAAHHDIDGDTLLIAGASGGGAPALATALLIRDQGLPLPHALVLLYPMLDDRNTSRSSREIVDLGVWDRPANLLAWSAVLGERAGQDGVTAYEAPARATDLRGLPTTFLAVAEYDVLHDEDLAFYAALDRDRVHAELHVYAGTYHAWDRFAPDSRLARDLDSAVESFVRRTVESSRGVGEPEPLPS